MKLVMILATLLCFSQAFAQDMSRTESYQEAYRIMPDGSSQYIGSCSLHEDYEGTLFSVTSTVIKYFEPWGMTRAQIQARLDVMDPKLLSAMKEFITYQDEYWFDDLTLEEIKLERTGQSFMRFNIGVGGGSGQYITYLKNAEGFEKVSHTFDGDLEFCDKKVWLK